MERDFVIVLSYIRTLEERLQIKSWRILLSSERADELRPPVPGGGPGNVRQQEAQIGYYKMVAKNKMHMGGSLW